MTSKVFRNSKYVNINHEIYFNIRTSGSRKDDSRAGIVEADRIQTFP